MQLSDTTKQEPIFITGSVRSGTSIVARALIHGAGISGYVEGCFIDFLGSFLRVVDFNYERRPWQRLSKQVMLGHIRKPELIHSLLQWFKTEYEQYAPSKSTWVDKTADKELLYAVPHIRQMWPHAKFIFMKRRSIENIASRKRKFSHIGFKNHCMLWVELNELMLQTIQQLPKESYMLIDQYDVATDPAGVARSLGVFLHLTPNQIESVERVFREDRPEFTGGDETNIRSLDAMPWTDVEKQTVRDVCGSLTERMGWSLTSSYYKR